MRILYSFIWNFRWFRNETPWKVGFVTKPLRVSYETVKDPHFPTKPFFKFRSGKKGFSAKGSSHGYTGRTFKGSVELKIRFLCILTHFETFSSLRNLFCGFRKEPIFLECSTIELLTDCFTIMQKVKAFDFDDPMSLDEESYYNMTDLKKGM